MDTLISIADVVLSLLVSILLIRILINSNRSINSNKKNTLFPIKIAGIITWVSLVWILGYNGFFEYKEGDTFPKFLIALFLPFLIAVALLFNSANRALADQISLKNLIGFQFWRIFGSIFFLVAYLKIGPPELMISGAGDLLTGSLAIITFLLLSGQSKFGKIFAWMFNLVGAADLLIILYIFLSNYPIWSDASPSSGIAGQFPLILIVGIVAPIALFFHVLAVRKLIINQK